MVKSNFLITIIAILLAIGVFVSNYPVKGPMIQADEGSYLANAAAIAGYPNDLASDYHAGYSLLISPAFKLAKSPQDVWTFVKAINTALFFMTVILLWILANKIFPNTEDDAKILAVILVALYPMWFVMAGYAFSQIAFVPVYLFTVLTFILASEGRRIYWAISGLLTGYLYWIHPTGLLVGVALIVSGMYLVVKEKSFSNFLFLTFCIVGTVLLYKYGFVPWLHERMTISGLDPWQNYPSESKFASKLMSILSFKNLFIQMISKLGGHLLYLTISSLGILWLGTFSLVKIFTNSKHIKYRAIALFMFLSFICILGLSVYSFVNPHPETQRLDHWMYGRYVEGVVAPILLVGILNYKFEFRKVLLVMPIGAVCAVLLSIKLEDYTHVAYFNISGFWPIFLIKEFNLWIWTLLGLVPIILLSLLPRRIGILLILGLFLFSAFLQINWHIAASENAVERWDAALKVRELYPPGTSVGFDHSGINSYNRHVFWFDFGFVLYDYRLQRMSLNQWNSSCDGPLFTYDRNLIKQGIKAYPLAASPHGGPWLWVKGDPREIIKYPISVSNRSPSLLLALGEGWYDIEKKHVWSGREAILRIPILRNCSSTNCSAIIHFQAYGASPTRPVEIFIESCDNASTTNYRIVLKEQTKTKLTIPITSKDGLYQCIVIKVPKAMSPKELEGSGDSRVLGVALYSIDMLEDAFLTPTHLNVGRFALEKLPRQVGFIKDGYVYSDNNSGFLVYGPYVFFSSGDYKLIVKGSANASSSWVDVVSDKGKVRYAVFPLKSNNSGIIASGCVHLNRSVSDLEVRVYVGRSDFVELKGYELAPASADEAFNS